MSVRNYFSASGSGLGRGNSRRAAGAAMERGFSRSHRYRPLAGIGILVVAGLMAAQGEPADTSFRRALTNLVEIRQAAEQELQVNHSLQIDAELVAVDAERGVLALRDDSGVEFIRAGFTNREVAPGMRVRLAGANCAVKRQGVGLALIPGLVVDHDGIHPATVRAGQVFLSAGMNPIKVEWFNRTGDEVLNLEYEGPNILRQRIPDAVLFRPLAVAPGTTNFSGGLAYRCYEGDWYLLPDFGKLVPVKTGVAPRFDLGVRRKNQGAGLELAGFIKVEQEGWYTFHLESDDGGRLFVGAGQLELKQLSEPGGSQFVGPAPARGVKPGRRQWVTREGNFVGGGYWSAGGEFKLRVNREELRVEIFDGSNVSSNLPFLDKVRVSGLYEEVLNEDGDRGPGRLLVLSWGAVEPGGAEGIARPGAGENPAGGIASNGRPLLVTAAEVKALVPEQARQQYPVSIRGVVTAFTAKHSGAVIQDATRGVFVDLTAVSGIEPLWRGEFCQVDGVTGPGFFAPMVVAHRITRLGPGQLPKPLRASWGQVMNGSLDTEYAEIEGLVTGVQDRRLMLLTQGGKVAVELREFRGEMLAGYAGAVVRIRGCWFAGFDLPTRKFEAGTLEVSGAVIELLEPPPSDVYAVRAKSIGELLYYDAKAAPFRRLKVSGQLVFSRGGEGFLTDGTNGIHVMSRATNRFEAGDLVEAVGFLELGGPAAVLKEAVMRRTGWAALPAPTKLEPNQLLLARYAATRVQTDATLMNSWREGAEEVMELQSGFLAFRARISSPAPSPALPPNGSRLELTGVYAAQGTLGGDGTVSGFELLLPAPAGLRVLSTPTWWTFQRVLILVGILSVLLLGVLIWNKELQTKVQRRGQQLETEIRHRQQAELERAAEAERSRIARDLHDELGTGLTEVSLLSSASLGEFRDGEKNRERFRVIAEKARSLVSSLDVIVWAVDPKHNSLQSLVDYLESYTKELLAASGIECRCRIPIECGAVALSGTARHSLLLAIKESLNNVIRHAAATEVELQMAQVGHQLEIVIADNGRGFDWGAIRRGNGLTNLQERLRNLGGQCRIESQPARGTKVTLGVPLAGAPVLPVKCSGSAESN